MKKAFALNVLLCSLFLSGIHFQSSFAQTCAGSLGAAVFTENFGTQTSCYGDVPLGAGVTDYSFRDYAGANGNSDNGDPPKDGEYVLWCRSTAPAWNWGLWHQTYADHTTGTGSGAGSNMAIFNLHGSVGTNGELYKRAVTGLCQSTNYTVTLYIANMADSDNEVATCGGSSLLPSLNIVVYNSGTTTSIASVATGNIPTSSNFTWIPYSLTFTTSASQTGVDLSFQNLIGAGCGNDIAIDDITFQACGPLLTNTATPSSTVTQGASMTFDGTIGAGYTSPVYQWQSSTDGVTWTDISGATSIDYTISSTVVADSKQYRLLTAESGNIGNVSCRIISNVVTLTVTTPTPVTLLNFKAVKNGSQVDIDWQTAAEINNDYFTVEKSLPPGQAGKNGMDFTVIGIVDGAGNSQSTLNYQTTDHSPYNGISYYRLKQTDFDGKVSYSNMEVVNFNDHKNITVYPNPGTGIFNIQGLNEEAELSVQNPLGQVVLIKKAFSDSLEIDLSSQPSGVYFIKANNGDGSKSIKIILYR
jgi:hypothetical protein